MTKALLNNGSFVLFWKTNEHDKSTVKNAALKSYVQDQEHLVVLFCTPGLTKR